MGETSKLPKHAVLLAAKLSPRFTSPSLAESDANGTSPGKGSGSSALATSRGAWPAVSQQPEPASGARADQIRGPPRLKSCLFCSPGTHAEEPPCKGQMPIQKNIQQPSFTVREKQSLSQALKQRSELLK